MAKNSTAPQPKTLYWILTQHGTDPTMFRLVGAQEAHGVDQARKQQFPEGSGDSAVVAVADSSWKPGKVAAKVPPAVLSVEPVSIPIPGFDDTPAPEEES